jgi:hypothetical protein
LHTLWLEFCDCVAPEELHHGDVVHFALNELVREAHNSGREELLERLRQHLAEIRGVRDVRDHRVRVPKSG